MITKILTIVSVILLAGCSRFRSLNSVEGKLHYDEHFSTFNDIDYKSGESEEYGISITGTERIKDKSWFDFSYSFYPDISYQSSSMTPSIPAQRLTNEDIEIRNLSTFLSTRGSFITPIGLFEASLGTGLSYIEAEGNFIDTSKLELAFRYEGSYLLFFTDWLYGTAKFTFQESTGSTYSEFYSISYNLGFLFR